MKHMILRLFKALGIITLPGLLVSFFRSFLLGYRLPAIMELVDNLHSQESVIVSIGLLYSTISILICPLSFAIYILLWRISYKKRCHDEYMDELVHGNNKGTRGQRYYARHSERIPVGCRACGGPYPDCRSSCNLFDE